MARIIRRHGGVGESSAGPGRKRGGSAREGAALPSSRKYQLKMIIALRLAPRLTWMGCQTKKSQMPILLYSPLMRSLRSLKLEEGQLLIHVADLYEMKRSLDDKITSLKVTIKSFPSTDILRRIKSATRKNYETQEEIYAHKSLLTKTRLKLVKHEARHRASTLIVAQDVEANGDPLLGYVARILKMD